jgi:hypothetical protein
VVDTQVWHVQRLPVKGSLSMLHSPNDVLKVGMKSLLLCLVLPYTVTSTVLDVCNEVFSFLLFALRWKNIVHASPSLNHISSEAYLLLDLSIAASPKTLFLSSLQRLLSFVDNCLLSRAISNLHMISFAMWSSIQVFANNFLL